MSEDEISPPRVKMRGWHLCVLVYLGLLLASHLVRLFSPVAHLPGPQQKVLSMPEMGAGAHAGRTVQLAYTDVYTGNPGNPPVVIILHGSPVGLPMFVNLIPELARNVRVIAPDFPGFDASSQSVSDYSIHAHALYTRAMLDSLDLHDVHLLAYSMGGGVGLHLVDLNPQRYHSLILLSAIGLQEYELLGDYNLNHSIHATQLAVLWLLHEATPHFGILDRFPLSVEYARNFYDTDQRPLRAIIDSLQLPVMIIHGEADGLIAPELAREHFRMVPQSELILYPAGHSMVIGDAPQLSADIVAFVEKVEQGHARTRESADPDRIAAAARPFNPSSVPAAEGIALFILMLGIALSTLVSEDLACIAAGLVAAKGIMGFWPATLAAFLGIFVGDVGLYLAGRFFGRAVLNVAPFRWMFRGKDLEASAKWFARRGPIIILLTRFLPGSRLPVYVTAGIIRAGFWMFTTYLLIAATIWTPILVGLAMMLGDRLLEYFIAYKAYALPSLIALIILIRLIVKLVVGSISHRGRRLLRSDFRRLTRWEFWPPYIFYIPVVFYVLYLGIRYRSLTLFSAANPAMPAGGIIGESKSDILDGIQAHREFIAAYAVIEAEGTDRSRLDQISEFATGHGGYPVVVKPDAGQRGERICIARSEDDVREYLGENPQRLIVQEYIAGLEFGIFYVRMPDRERGEIFSVTDKRMLTLTGDGQKNLQQLILDDDRALSMARFHLEKHQDSVFEVPAKGSDFKLVEIGTHCKGALFLDGNWVRTDSLGSVIDSISRGYDGFYFGRYDIRAHSIEELQQGRGFKIIELNGVTSEATHIYDPSNSLLSAYKTLFRQWSLAFEIGRQNRARGVDPVSLRHFFKLLFD